MLAAWSRNTIITPINKNLSLVNKCGLLQGNAKDTSIKLTLIGPPGSGKGTQAAKLNADFGLITKSTGELLRAAVRNKTALGREAEGQMAGGGLVDDKLMLSIVKEALFAKELMKTGWVLDGYPRTINQASNLDALLKGNYQTLTYALYLQVDEKIIIERLSARWVHESSGRIYNLQYKKPKNPGIDDVTGEPLTQRHDDKPEVITERLKIFNEKTKPILEYYEKVKLLRVIDSPTSDIGYIQIKKLVSEAIIKK